MTACATVTDVLALAPTPYALTQGDVRRALGVGYARAKVVLELACAAYQRQVEQRVAEFGVLPSQADEQLRTEWRHT